MKTKYIKVSVSVRKPEKLGDYLTDKGKALFITTTKLWHIDKLRISPNWWLEEKPDYEDEMMEMINELISELDVYSDQVDDLFIGDFEKMEASIINPENLIK